MLMPLKPLFEPERLGGDERVSAGYELEDYPGFWQGAALSQIPDKELDLEKSTCAAKQQRCSPAKGEA